ncbi:MAG: transcriptional regulator, LysR family protein [Bacteriovoracaceae bacterium]|nr:transcriptional regulator, LysR family protein [Bacteriovoracaceae bacterium]
MRDLNEIQCFVRAVELKSLTAAAKSLDLPKSSVSRKIRNLEAQLGMTLLVRTTRALSLTDAGRSFFEKSARALKEIENAVETLDGSRQTVEGTLRITAPMVFATGQFNDIVVSFMDKYPKIKIDLVLTERVVDLIAENFDLAFRIGELADSTLIAKKLISIDASVVASPRYLKNHGTPKTLADLDKHEFILFSPNEVPIKKWSMKGLTGKKDLMPRGRLNINHILSVKEAAIRGSGLALLPNYMITNEVKNNELKVVLPNWMAKGNPIHLVFPGQKFVSPKMREFIDHVTKNFS